MEKIIGVRENGSMDSDRKEARAMLQAVKQLSKLTNKRSFTDKEIRAYLRDVAEYYEKLEARIKQ